MTKIIVPIKGMHCKSCEITIEDEYKKIPGVKSAKADFRCSQVELHSDNNAIDMEAVKEATKNAGYVVGKDADLTYLSTDRSDYQNLFFAGLIVLGLYSFTKMTGLLSLNVNTENAGLAIVVLVGLVAGFSTCMALVGGLVLALSAQHNLAHPEATRWQRFQPHIYFNIGRVIGFGILGGLIGLIGSAISPSAGVMGFLTIIVGVVMIILGLKLVEIFPKLKTWNLTLPKGIAKLLGIKKGNQEYSRNQALVSGALTFFLPCGFTQAMQLYAVSTGSFWQGLAVMSFFAVGTTPGLIGVGGLSSWFKGQKARLFFAVAGIAVIVMGIYNISNASKLFSTVNPQNNNSQETATVQEIRMTQDFDGYTPNILTVQKGKTVKWIITSKTAFSCASSIVMPKFGISRSLKKGENIITFTPTETGVIPFSCSMGMYTGKFIVTDSIAPTSALPTTSKILAQNSGTTCGMMKNGGSCGGGTVTAQSNIDSSVDLSTAQIIKSNYTQLDDVYPNDLTVKSGVPVKWVINMEEPPTGCMRNIVISDLNVTEPMSQSGETTVVFLPTKKGDYRVTCSMGIHRATIHVI